MIHGIVRNLRGFIVADDRKRCRPVPICRLPLVPPRVARDYLRACLHNRTIPDRASAGRILHMRAADLDNVLPLLNFQRDRVVQRLHFRDQPLRIYRWPDSQLAT